MITKQDFDFWYEHPVTKEVFEILKLLRTENMDLLLRGQFNIPNTVPLMAYGETIGRLNAYDDLLKIEYGDLPNSEREEQKDE